MIPAGRLYRVDGIYTYTAPAASLSSLKNLEDYSTTGGTKHGGENKNKNKKKSRGGKLLKVTSADLMTTEENKTRKKKQHNRPILHRDTMQEYSPAGPAREYIYACCPLENNTK